MYIGHIQGQDLAFEFDKSTVPILNITHNAFNNTLSLTQTIELRKHDQTALAVQAITLLVFVKTRSYHFRKNNNLYLF